MTSRTLLVTSFVLCITLPAPSLAASQQTGARSLVQRVVNGELAADAKDHSHWMFEDYKKVPGKSTLKLVVQTAEGNISKTIEIDGHAPTMEERKDDADKLHKFLTDPSVRQQQSKDQQQDGAKARALTEMLPDAFLWKIVRRHGAETTLAFDPNPHFSPPTHEAQVFAAMKGTMVVNTEQNRIVSLRGVLTQDVDFGFGILGQLEKGGTFDVQRTQVGPGIWEITATHIHIQGHMLLFKSISEQQDEVTSHYKPVPPGVSMAAAARMLNNGAAARELNVHP
ncbi:MAG: hypothetical protein WA594_15405, partial [Candidatus Sulfotelmatobacter sp.]